MEGKVVELKITKDGTFSKIDLGTAGNWFWVHERYELGTEIEVTLEKRDI